MHFHVIEARKDLQKANLALPISPIFQHKNIYLIGQDILEKSTFIFKSEQF